MLLLRENRWASPRPPQQLVLTCNNPLPQSTSAHLLCSTLRPFHCSSILSSPGSRGNGLQSQGRNSSLNSELGASGHLVVSPCHCTTVSPIFAWAGHLSGKNVWAADTMKTFGTQCVISDSSRGHLFPSPFFFPPAQLTSAGTIAVQNGLPTPTLPFSPLSDFLVFSRGLLSLSMSFC